MGHTVTIIQVLVTLIILLTSYVLYRVYSQSSEVSAAPAAPVPNFEEALNKLIELQKSTPVQPVEVPPDMEALREELIKSKNIIKELEEKNLDLALKAEAAAAAAPAADPAEAEGLRAKVNDLESRLSEYEIIAEDIADLGRYKEENVKLQKELEGLRGTPAAVDSPEVSAAAEIVVDDTPSVEVTDSPEIIADAAPTPPAEPAMASPEVASEEESIAEVAAPVQPAKVEAVAAPVAANSGEESIESAFAEFAQSVSASQGTPEKASLPIEPPPPPRDEDKYKEELLSEFEGFIKKK